MADINVSVVTTKRPNVPSEYTYTELAADDNAIVPCKFKDEHTMLLFQGGSGSATVTIKAGNAYAGVNDEVFEVPADAYMAVTINSNRFKNISGDYKGSMVLSVSAACSLAVVEARV